MAKRKRRERPSAPRAIQAALEPEGEVILLPASERGLSPSEVARFDKARADLLNPNLALRDEQRETRARTMAAIESRPRADADRDWREQAAAETARLARARNEDVTVTPTGSVRIMSRGGLTQAYEDGHLTPERGPLHTDDLYTAAKAYRDDYEVVEGRVTGEKGSGGFGPKGPQPRMVEAGFRLAAKRAALSARQQAVLDLVCGEDRRLRTAADELRRGFLSCRNSLRGGLAELVRLKIDAPDNLRDRLAAQTAAICGAQNAA